MRKPGQWRSQSLQIGGLFQTELGLCNRLDLPDAEILKNVHAFQEANDIEKVVALQGREFSIEMETGTGKTYVYLRTIFELNKTYGFRKFIIVVPSVADPRRRAQEHRYDEGAFPDTLRQGAA